MRDLSFLVFLSCLLFILNSNSGFTQDDEREIFPYRSSFGVRAGTFIGVTFKRNLNEKSTIEGMVTSRWKGINFVGLYERHGAIFKAKRLRYFYGIGGNLGVFGGQHVPFTTRGGDHTLLGIQWIFGTEFTLKNTPFNISLDWNPSVNVMNVDYFWISGIWWLDAAAVSVRYVFD